MRISLLLGVAAVAVLVLLRGCPLVPSAPKSLYFARLIAEESRNGPGRASTGILIPEDVEAETFFWEALYQDGFYSDPLEVSELHSYSSIMCGNFEFYALKGREDGGYSQRLLWCGIFTIPPFTTYVMDVVVDGQCSPLAMSGFLWPNS